MSTTAPEAPEATGTVGPPPPTPPSPTPDDRDPGGGEAAVKRAVSYALVPFALVGCALASAPWLRAFPSSFLVVPLFGAALLSVLLPVVVIAIGIRRLWLTALIDILGFTFFTTLVALQHPSSIGRLYHGLVDGPSQILTYALPLTNQRTLLVAPVALCWISGAVLGECIGRGWRSVLPYATLLVTFGLSYAGSARAIASAADGRRYDTILAASLLLAMLLMRAAQAWLEQDTESVATTSDARLPVRGLVLGVLASVVVAALVALLAQSSVFGDAPRAPARTPPVDVAAPVSPVAFVADLRPSDPQAAGSSLFKVTLSRSSPNYIAIADVDTYNGDAWSLGERQFRPSGGVVPVDRDPSSRPQGPVVTQRFRIGSGALTDSPWMPFMIRPSLVSDIAVGVDPDSGMIVPTSHLRAGEQFTVQSRTPTRAFDRVPSKVLPATSAPASDTQLGALNDPLTPVVAALRKETGTEGASPIVFLQALQKDLRANYALSGSPGASSSASPSGASSPGPSPSGSAGSSPAKASSTPGTQTSGGTSFSNVLASILGQTRSATPEQYATLVALVARKVDVAARVVTGFRLPTGAGGANGANGANGTVAAGTYDVTTAQAWTWVEVSIRGYGWVVLDAAPGRYSTQRPQPSASPRPSLRFTPTTTQRALIANNDDGHAAAPPSTIPDRGALSGPAIALIVVAGLLAVLLLLVAIRWLQKERRLRRRRRGDARSRVVGAWQELLDLLVEAGLPELATLTSAEVARVTRARFGRKFAAQVALVGTAANAALFRTASAVADADADAAWRSHLLLRRAVRRRLRWSERVRAFVRFHHPERVGAPVGPASWSLAARNRAAAARGQTPRRAH